MRIFSINSSRVMNTTQYCYSMDTLVTAPTLSVSFEWNLLHRQGFSSLSRERVKLFCKVTFKNKAFFFNFVLVFLCLFGEKFGSPYMGKIQQSQEQRYPLITVCTVCLLERRTDFIAAICILFQVCVVTARDKIQIAARIQHIHRYHHMNGQLQTVKNCEGIDYFEVY